MKYVEVKNGTLYTPIVQHRRGELIVTSIGTVHIGTSNYYERLQAELDKLPFGFFERVKPLTNEENVPQEKRQYIEGMQRLGELSQRFADYLGIVTQHQLKYPDNWQNPDITLDELITVAPDKVLKKISGLTDQMDELEEFHETNPEELTALIKGAMKYLSNVPFLRGIVSFLTHGPMYQKIILEKRNQKLFDAMEPELEQPRVDGFGIIYGAAHLKGIDNFLIHKGFKSEGGVWIPALDLESEISLWHATKTIFEDSISGEIESK